MVLSINKSKKQKNSISNRFSVFNFLADKTGNCIDIFDIDNTLVITNAKIKVNNLRTGKVLEISPDEFNRFQVKNHMILDFSDFNCDKILSEGIIIENVFELLKKSILDRKAVGIITARENPELIQNFLLKNGVDVNPKFIFTVGGTLNLKYRGSISERKKIAFKELIDMGFNDFTFYDDDLNNLKMAKSLISEYNIKMQIFYVKNNGEIKRIKN